MTKLFKLGAYISNIMDKRWRKGFNGKNILGFFQKDK